MIWFVKKLLVKLQTESQQNNSENNSELQMRMIKKYPNKDIYISPEERQKIIDNLGINIIV